MAFLDPGAFHGTNPVRPPLAATQKEVVWTPRLISQINGRNYPFAASDGNVAVLPSSAVTGTARVNGLAPEVYSLDDVLGPLVEGYLKCSDSESAIDDSVATES